jgi:hypothetical protein
MLVPLSKHMSVIKFNVFMVLETCRSSRLSTFQRNILPPSSGLKCILLRNDYLYRDWKRITSRGLALSSLISRLWLASPHGLINFWSLYERTVQDPNTALMKDWVPLKRRKHSPLYAMPAPNSGININKRSQLKAVCYLLNVLFNMIS